MSWWLLAIVVWFVVSFGVVALVVSRQITAGRRTRNALQTLPDLEEA
jgi:hypothetical protein